MLRDDILKNKFLFMESGKEPKIITMNQKTYDKVCATIEDVIAFDEQGITGAMIFGLRMAINNGLADGNMLITDDYLQKGAIQNE